MNLVRYEAARVALKEARRVDEAKDIHDKAEAVRAYARQVNDTEMVSWASEIKLRAMRRMGELLKETERATGAQGIGKSGVLSTDTTLPDLGVSRNASSLSQKISRSPPAGDRSQGTAGDGCRGYFSIDKLFLGYMPCV